MRKFSSSPHPSLPWSSDDAPVRYAVLALAILALLLVAARYSSRAPARTDVPAIELLDERKASAEEPTKPTKPRRQKRKSKPSVGGGVGAAPASPPAPATAGDDDSDDGDDD